MTTVLKFMKPLLLCAAFALAAAFAPEAAAQPPELMHYQGRLTDLAGTPVTSPTTVYFSLWSGGSATTASSGTQFYREHATITPNANGYFSYQIGSGTVDAGSFDAESFDIDDDVFIQIAAGSVSNVLLPRVQVATVGYAFVAGRLAGTEDDDSSISVSSLTDVTGGDVVVGDLMRIAGSGLSESLVTVGGLGATIVSQNSAQIDFRIPQGLPMGVHQVLVTEDADGGESAVAASVNVHRLVIGVSSEGTGSDYIYVLDASDQTLKALLDNDDYAIGKVVDGPTQIGFVNDGSAALIPDNNNGKVYVVDMTAEPPVVADYVDFGAPPCLGVTASPNGSIAVACAYNTSTDTVRAIPINESEPPYSSAFFDSTGKNLDIPTGFEHPRACAFFGDSLMVALGESSAVGYHRTDDSDYFEGTLDDGDSYKVTSGINAPISAVPSSGRSRLFTVDASNNLGVYYLEPRGLSDSATGDSISVQAGVLAVTLNAADNTLLAADSGNNAIHSFHVSGGDLVHTGYILPPEDCDSLPQLAAMDPVDGSIVAVGTEDSTVLFYKRTGPALEYLNEITDMYNSSRTTFALAFQP